MCSVVVEMKPQCIHQQHIAGMAPGSPKGCQPERDEEINDSKLPVKNS